MGKKLRRSAIRVSARRPGSPRLALLLIVGTTIGGLVLAIGVRHIHQNAASDAPESDNLEGWSNLDWTVKYDGYGEVGVEDGSASLKPRSAQSADETSAALALAGVQDWRDYSFTVRMNLQQQLRQNSPPNPWEAGWLFFRYQSDHRSYYLAHKTNGLELGKLVQPAGQGQSHGENQVFLATAPAPPAEPGRWYDYRIDVRGPKIQVYVDDELQMTYVDPDPILNGRVGLYTEDAHVLFQDPDVRQLSSDDDENASIPHNSETQS